MKMKVTPWLQGMQERRSIRRFKAQSISTETLSNLLEAARWAPSWANSQCCELVVVEDVAIKEQLAETLSPKNPASLAVKNAPLTLAICGAVNKAGFYNGQPLTKFGDWMLYDLGLVTQNICLAAHGAGMGSVIVGAFDHHKVKKILSIPEGVECVSLLPIGYPDQAPSPPKRKPQSEFVHNNTF